MDIILLATGALFLVFGLYGSTQTLLKNKQKETEFFRDVRRNIAFRIEKQKSFSNMVLLYTQYKKQTPYGFFYAHPLTGVILESVKKVVKSAKKVSEIEYLFDNPEEIQTVGTFEHKLFLQMKDSVEQKIRELLPSDHPLLKKLYN